MAIFNSAQRRVAVAISRLVYCNPFTPERIACEKQALGSRFISSAPVWSLSSPDDAVTANVSLIAEQVEEMVAAARDRLLRQPKASPADLELYEDLALYRLYARLREPLSDASERIFTGQKDLRLGKAWPAFVAQFKHDLNLPGLPALTATDPAHVFACFFQLRRAFTNIFGYLVGASMPMAKLRAQVWESIFTHDLKRYHRGLYRHMGDFTTLVTGESGTGKELVARAIGRSRYLPFDLKQGGFKTDQPTAFQAVNLAALSPTLIESELFGHRKGAFTGATADRIGWLENCPPGGTVFLDEIGELDASLQVKLLRVLQTRTFERLGDTQPRQFVGKVIAATHRDLAAAMATGRFRADLYFRLCSDVIHTPSLREQLADRQGDLPAMVDFVTRRIAADAHEAQALTDEVVRWIADRLGAGYPWPGNFRELEQCVRNVIVHGCYEPVSSRSAEGEPDAAEVLAEQMLAGSLSVEDLVARYVKLVHEQTGSYEATARRIGLDRRTVKAKVVTAQAADH